MEKSASAVACVVNPTFSEALMLRETPRLPGSVGQPENNTWINMGECASKHHGEVRMKLHLVFGLSDENSISRLAAHQAGVLDSTRAGRTLLEPVLSWVTECGQKQGTSMQALAPSGAV